MNKVLLAVAALLLVASCAPYQYGGGPGWYGGGPGWNCSGGYWGGYGYSAPSQYGSYGGYGW
ncbi:hypothetical protein [Fundidesulfovibrio putealis]|uniref:hypothetical protein n=1 Tax=Fundidesulfovibrio putealis TaxID=270496 RepID=UPI0005B81674|nr:hypothetical protein [Fundidesulfovibrio putealis]